MGAVRLKNFPANAFAQAFPFHFWLNLRGEIVQTGEVLRRLIPALENGSLPFEHLKIIRPEVEYSKKALVDHEGEIWLLEYAATGLRLRGEFVAIEGGDTVFLGSPWATEMGQLSEWGVSLDDYAAHNPMADQLLLLRGVKASLDDTREMAVELEREHADLIETENRISLLLKQTPLAIIDWDTQGRITEWNPGAERMFGLGREQALQNRRDILGQVYEENLLSPPQNIPCGERAFGSRTRHKAANGEELIGEWMNTPLTRADGTVIGTASIIRDVTQSVQTENRLRESQQLESLGLLAGGVAHDFNNFLAGILGNAELAVADLPQDSKARSYLQQVVLIAEKSGELTRELLAFSGGTVLEMKSLSVSDLIQEMQPLLKLSVDRRAMLICDDIENVPMIRADASQLRQVILNLVINGAEALDGSGEVSVQVASRKVLTPLYGSRVGDSQVVPGDYVSMTVSDSGTGMDEETLEKAFDPFFTTKFTGRGLGLAAILGIIRGHGAHLFLRSSIGKGTSFEVLFPAIETPVEAKETPPSPVLERASARLLIVDDEATLREVLEICLTGAGFQVVCAQDGKQALELYDNDVSGFDLVITDLTMPVMDGIELFKNITERDPRFPVILMSGYSDYDEDLRYIDGTQPAFLKKPHRLQELLDTIQLSLSHQGSTRLPSNQK